MIGNVDLNCPSPSSSGSFSLIPGQTLEDLPLAGAMYVDTPFQRSPQDDQHRLNGQQKQSQTRHQLSNLAGLGESIAGQSRVQASGPGDTCDSTTRRVTI